MGDPNLKGFLDGWCYKIRQTSAEGNVEIYTKERLASNDELEIREPEHSVFKPASLSLTVPVCLSQFAWLLRWS